MRSAYIYDHVRTPRGRGRPGGGLNEITPIELATQVLGALRDRNDIDTTAIEDVVMGVVMAVGEQGANMARIAALNAGYAESVPGYQLNRYCASGLEAMNISAARLVAGEVDGIVASGVESMSRVPIQSDGGACYSDPQVNWRTWYIPQGIGADLIATLDGFSRESVDAYALESHRRAAAAWQGGRFDRSIQPVRDVTDEVILTRDEHIRPHGTMADLARLDPAFAGLGGSGFDGVMLQRYPEVERINHVHTAGNASGIVDGAAAILLGTEQFGEVHGLAPRARVRAYATVGSEPAIMLTGPAAATRRALDKAGLGLDDIDLFEINEAFASVVLHYMDELHLDQEKVNVNGGAIAMGHPLGATGAMLVGTVLDELERRNLRRGLITLCAAAGMATATIIERT
ncbi:MAG: acetyl-CoA acetyltransferase [Alphaproteobacteria bacterium]|nr:MAG: acetyl-CoA acetyltransferase [Alphaproteobacteria bacterium]